MIPDTKTDKFLVGGALAFLGVLLACSMVSILAATVAFLNWVF